jgi:hypothetical protein
MTLPPRLAKEIEELETKPEVVEDGGVVNLVFKNRPIPPGYTLPAADLLLRVPLAYPDAGPDMFWTDPALTLQGGRHPQAGDLVESYIGRRWRRFSWHTKWRPTIDNLESYLLFVRRRLDRAC